MLLLPVPFQPAAPAAVFRCYITRLIGICADFGPLRKTVRQSRHPILCWPAGAVQMMVCWPDESPFVREIQRVDTVASVLRRSTNTAQ